MYEFQVWYKSAAIIPFFPYYDSIFPHGKLNFAINVKITDLSTYTLSHHQIHTNLWINDIIQDSRKNGKTLCFISKVCANEYLKENRMVKLYKTKKSPFSSCQIFNSFCSCANWIKCVISSKRPICWMVLCVPQTSHSNIQDYSVEDKVNSVSYVQIPVDGTCTLRISERKKCPIYMFSWSLDAAIRT